MKNPVLHIRLGLLAALVSIAVLLGLSTSCHKTADPLDEGFGLRFSEDTIAFDTVFTTIGTSTQYLVVHNTESEPVRISNIYLAGGGQSNFRINVDGLPGTHFKDVVIEGKDSLYIFVEVTVDPNNSTAPMVITDSIVFDKKGSIQDVDLVACGVDAYFILPDHFNISGLPYNIVAGEGVDTTWTNDKPIVIYGYAAIDSTGSLTIEEGTQIYFHANSGLWAYKYGRLIVNGTKDNPVTFQDDRPEAYYDDKPGQWDRIWLNEHQQDHIIRHAIIKNSFIGIQAENLAHQNQGNKLILENTIIENISGAGVLSRNYNIDMNNCVIANAQQYSATLHGGDYNLQHVTLANYWNYSIRHTPALVLANYYDIGQTRYAASLDASIVNSIVYGNVAEEFVKDSIDAPGLGFDYHFENVLIKTQLTTANGPSWTDILKNIDPQFEDYNSNDYHLQSTSPAIEAGKAGVLSFDLEENPRDPSQPDLGAYEYQ